MKKMSVPVRIFRFYAEGFRSMTLGRTLWLIILIKLFIMFCILRPIFFHKHLGQFEGEEAKQEYVSGELIQRAVTP